MQSQRSNSSSVRTQTKPRKLALRLFCCLYNVQPWSGRAAAHIDVPGGGGGTASSRGATGAAGGRARRGAAPRGDRRGAVASASPHLPRPAPSRQGRVAHRRAVALGLTMHNLRHLLRRPLAADGCAQRRTAPDGAAAVRPAQMPLASLTQGPTDGYATPSWSGAR